MSKTFLCVFVLVLSILAWPSKLSGQGLAITGATVYSSPDAAPKRNTTVLIEHGVIVAVGLHPRLPKGVRTLPCKGCFVFAGFWNAHVHFMEPKWNDAAHLLARDLQSQLDAMLTHSGFTTVVDTGSDVENTVALRNRVQRGEVLGPRILTAGLPLFPAGQLPYYLADLPADFKAKLGQPRTPVDAKAFVESNRAAGADLVKLFTGSIVGPNHIVPMDIGIARAAADEAHRRNQLAFSHPSDLAGTTVAIEAGVDVLAHTPEETQGIDDAMLRRMLAQHMSIIPTLKLFSRDNDIAKIRGLDYRYYKLGGRLVYGTDTGFLQDYEQGEEFHQLSSAGFSFREILAMLTTAPTELFHLPDEGKVLPGMRADLTVLSEDPASGLSAAFTKVKYTIRGGKVIWQATAR